MNEPCLSLIGTLPAIELAQVEARSSLQTRVDRKYILEADQASKAVEARGDEQAVLEIGGRRWFDYSSLYFDTVDHLSYRLTATQRLHRFKVRTRRYLGQDLCFLEVKTLGRRGETIKQRIAYADADHQRLTDEGRDFIDGIVGAGAAEQLRPSVRTGYQRATIVNLVDGSRATIDTAFSISEPDGPWRPVGDQVIVETKTLGRPSSLDRSLWHLGSRPERLSKFGVATAILNPSMSANRWNHALRHHFHWTPPAIAA